jgi:hypothetical protein
MRTPMTVGALLALGAASTRAQGWDTRLTSVDEYLYEESYEIVLARNAAPDHIAAEATVLVLERDGYSERSAGSNGFTCLVERSWSSPIGPHIDFFNPKLRAPICYNAEAARTVLIEYLRRTELALAGQSIGRIRDSIAHDLGTGKIPAPRELAMSYMLSGAQLLGTETGRYKPHVMFHVPYATQAHLGPHRPGRDDPVMFEHAGGPLAAFIVPVARFNEVPR